MKAYSGKEETLRLVQADIRAADELQNKAFKPLVKEISQRNQRTFLLRLSGVC